MAGRFRQFEPSITLRKVHDVRRLDACAHCLDIGDQRFMVRMNGALVHGGCALEIAGVPGLLALSQKDQDRLTIGEIGADAMRALIEARAGTTSSSSCANDPYQFER